MDDNLYLNEEKVETAESYQFQSELNDMKQHADKIIQGIKKLDSNDANRAIWELFQNAVDLSENCHVQIGITENTFEFSHNGEPFTSMTLDCLFKQVSSKTLEEKKLLFDEKDPVGQYGTGFLTTHTFGKEIVIDGALIKGDDYISLEQFTINRFTDNWKELAERIRNLKKEVAALLNSQNVKPKPYPRTKFTYKTVSAHNRQCAVNAISSLRLILPYVMTLNPKLDSIVVTDLDSIETVYKKKEVYTKGNIQIRPILVNTDVVEVCYLESDDKRITVILPINQDMGAFDFSHELPKLFLYYPLIGTHSFGFNFIIHSRHFQPTEPRNGLYLKSDNDSNEKDEEVNRLLIEKASEMVFEFIKTNSAEISSPIKLATINFNTSSDDLFLNEYFKGLKTLWINELQNYNLLETDAGNIQPSEALFLHQELIQDDKSNNRSFDAVFALANQFWKNIPKKHLIKDWTRIIDEWNIETIKYIRIKDIVDKIQEAANLSAFTEPENLKQFYSFLIAQGHSDVFNSCKLLPNIKGEFRALLGNEGLKRSLNLSKELIEIADVIMPDIPKRHVHPEFKFSLEFTDYSRKNYTTEINEHIVKQVGEKATSKTIQQDFLQKLLEYCKIATSSDSASVPIKMMKLISRYYNQSEELIIISAIKDDELDIRAPQKRLLKLFLNDISCLEKSWVEDNLDFLKGVISTGNNYEAYEEMFQTLPIFPNQLNELSEQSFLKVDDNIPEEIKNLYDKVVKPDFPIRANLVHVNFAEYLKNKQKKTIKDLTEKIESEFFNEQTQFSINDHPFKKEILDIIEKIKTFREYENYFKLVFSKRSAILVELADGEDTFSILSLDSTRIKKLATLGNNPDFDEIVKLGESALMSQWQVKANFRHKYFIGTLVEGIIRERLAHIIGLRIQKPEEVIESTSEIKTSEEQDGQDIIIYIEDTPIYYIEVKSRWNENTPFRISRNQTIRAYDNNDKYSLITVDMTKSTVEKKYSIADISEIRDVIRVHKDIGEKLEKELVDLYNGSVNHDSFHIDGDFRTYVPFSYLDNGIELEEFEDYLIKAIQNKYDQPNQ